MLALAPSNDKSNLKDKFERKLLPRLIIRHELKDAFGDARANNGKLLIPRKTTLLHRERFAFEGRGIVRESSDDGKQKWRPSRPPFFATVREQFLAVAIPQSDQFCTVRGNFRNQALAPRSLVNNRSSVVGQSRNTDRDRSRKRRLGVHIAAA